MRGGRRDISRRLLVLFSFDEHKHWAFKAVPCSFVCPCCGYPALTVPAYTTLRHATVPMHGSSSPPYCRAFGEASYDVCHCCGYEYGFDDEPGTGPGTAFEHYLTAWMADGCHWLRPEARPKDWDLMAQLRRAGIAMPNQGSGG